MPTTTKHNRLTCLQIGQKVALFLIHHHRFTHCTAVVFSKQAMDDFAMRVFDDVGNQLGRNLIGNNQACAIFTHLGQHIGKRLNCKGGGFVAGFGAR